MGDVLEEHYSYLSDAKRLERFGTAVSRAVSPGDSVVDIGSGFGVLGLLCLKAGAAHVWGIDETPAIEIARETMARSGLAELYTCVHESSFRVELPRKVDIAICDHVGFFGLDYGIIDALGDARRRLLEPGGKVLPGRIVLDVAAVRSPKCRALAEGWAADPILEEFRWLREYGVNKRHPHDFAADELASVPARLGTVDLHEDSPELLSFTTTLSIDRDGPLDGLAGWFACELFDGVWMTNSPLADDRINRAQAFLPFARPLAAQAGDTLEVRVSIRHAETLLSWQARLARTGETARQSTWASRILDPHDLAPAAGRKPCLSPAGEARKALLALIDGRRTDAEIEEAALRDHGDLFPTREQVARFVRAELHRNTR